MSALLTKDNVCILSNISDLDRAFKSDKIAPSTSKEQWYRMPMPIRNIVVAFDQFMTLSCDGQVHQMAFIQVSKDVYLLESKMIEIPQKVKLISFNTTAKACFAITEDNSIYTWSSNLIKEPETSSNNG